MQNGHCASARFFVGYVDFISLIKHGLCGAIYTQLTDVEDETNGLITYDRAITKVDPQKMQELAKELTI